MSNKKLFTTLDNVDIYDGDRVFAINNGSWIIKVFAEWSAKNNWYYEDTTKHFSTREKALEYIILNKPCLALKDILEEDEYCGELLKTLVERLKIKISKKL